MHKFMKSIFLKNQVREKIIKYSATMNILEEEIQVSSNV